MCQNNWLVWSNECDVNNLNASFRCDALALVYASGNHPLSRECQDGAISNLCIHVQGPISRTHQREDGREEYSDRNKGHGASSATAAQVARQEARCSRVQSLHRRHVFGSKSVLSRMVSELALTVFRLLGIFRIHHSRLHGTGTTAPRLHGCSCTSSQPDILQRTVLTLSPSDRTRPRRARSTTISPDCIPRSSDHKRGSEACESAAKAKIPKLHPPCWNNDCSDLR